jgi:hypothetical protein
MILVSSDDVTIEVADAAAVMSDLLKGMMEDLDSEVTEKQQSVPIFGVDGQTLTSVIEFCEAHVRMADTELSDWDAEFIKGHGEEALLALTNAASYMAVEPLFELGCCRIADLMRDKDPEEVRMMMAR